MASVQLVSENSDIKFNPMVRELYPALYVEVVRHDLDSNSSWYELSDKAYAEYVDYMNNASIGFYPRRKTSKSEVKSGGCCPKCGGTGGFRATFKGFQYYTWTGDTAGYDLDQMSEQKTAFCIGCGYAFPKAPILRGKG